MKVNLVVAQGVHTGKKIPIVTTSEFIIGRDANCQLRPASPSISKQHCALSVRGEQVFVRDCGSTNGTFVNDEQIAGEQALAEGDKLRVGPLEFTISLEQSVIIKPASVTETVSAKAVETVIAKPLVVPPAASALSGESDDAEQMAAMMLGFDDVAGGTPTVENFNPDSTTVMEMPALGVAAKPGQEQPKKDEKKTHGDSSSAAAEALSKYMRRPRT